MGRVKQFDREEVLKKATDVFWERGYADTSMKDLASAMNMNAFSIYAEFESKEGLFVEVLKAYQHQNYQQAALALSGVGSGFSRIEMLFTILIERLIATSTGRGCLTVNTTAAAKTMSRRIQDMLRENDRAFIALFEEVVAQGQGDGSITRAVDAKAIAASLYASHHGLRVLEHTTHDSATLNSIVNTILHSLSP